MKVVEFVEYGFNISSFTAMIKASNIALSASIIYVQVIKGSKKTHLLKNKILLLEF